MRGVWKEDWDKLNDYKLIMIGTDHVSFSIVHQQIDFHAFLPFDGCSDLHDS